jgi:cytidine deaminase
MTDFELLTEAWLARDKAYAWKSGTKVGCAIETKTGNVIQGWNVEGQWMTSVHAEVCAVIQLAGTNNRGVKVALVAETEFFVPCGACRDWLYQFCDFEAEVLVQGKDRKIHKFLLNQLCSDFPRQ